LSKPVEVWRFENWIAAEAEVTVALIVSQNDDYIGTGPCESEG